MSNTYCNNYYYFNGECWYLVWWLGGQWFFLRQKVFELFKALWCFFFFFFSNLFIFLSEDILLGFYEHRLLMLNFCFFSYWILGGNVHFTLCYCLTGKSSFNGKCWGLMDRFWFFNSKFWCKLDKDCFFFFSIMIWVFWGAKGEFRCMIENG